MYLDHAHLARAPRRRRLLPFLAAALLAVACRGATIPDEAPYVMGPIQQVLADGRIRVASEAGEPCGAVVTVSPRTRIRTRGGRTLDRSALTVGKRVSVWITGAVLESCPTQVSARFVVVEPPAAP